jgi:hypothetical protein
MKYIVTDGIKYFGPFKGGSTAERFGHWYFTQNNTDEKKTHWEVIKVYLPIIPDECKRPERVTKEERRRHVEGGRL